MTRTRKSVGLLHKRGLSLLCVLVISSLAPSIISKEKSISGAIFLEQRTAFLSSHTITIGGVGGGLGGEILYRKHYALELHTDIFWALGNTYALGAAVGIQRDGRWQPGVRATASLLLGDRIEMLQDDGRRPPRPNWAMGIRLVPLRFAGDAGFASALEIGIGSDFSGLFIDLIVLKAGARF
jgi:hypothetical protein